MLSRRKPPRERAFCRRALDAMRFEIFAACDLRINEKARSGREGRAARRIGKALDADRAPDADLPAENASRRSIRSRSSSASDW